MTEIFRISAKANFRDRAEAVAFIAVVNEYLDPKAKAEIAFGCDIDCEASEKYRKDIKAVAEIAELK